MVKTLLTPDKTEVSEKSTSFVINLAQIATYVIVAMCLASVLQLKTSFSSRKTPQNAIIKNPNIIIPTKSEAE
jgi:hypothetical protein